ncbi:MAG: aminopeptidase [Flammeovirgaceae bacterium]
MSRIILGFYLWLTGWKTTKSKPQDVKKYMVIVVPHTSNWDFPKGVACRPFINLQDCKFLIKKNWLDSPIGFFIKWLGAVPVDRSKEKGNLVEQVVEMYNKADTLGLAIAPEGTRSLNGEWKTGFYHIAKQANIPIYCSYIDYYRREIGIENPIIPSGDYEKDLAEIKQFYLDKIPRYPEKSSLEHRIPTTKRGLWFHLKPYVRKLLVLLLILLAFNWDLIAYGLGQAYGQFKILYQAQPVETFLTDPNYPEAKKEKIRLIQEVRQYAFDSLGLDHSKSYSKLYDQQGEAILWNVTACEPYQLKAVEWSFPIIGSFSYKGFFDKEKAASAEAALKKEGFDTNIREVGGWSTLGLLNDPILSNMLERSEGSLANLIIHELTHGTIFIKDGVAYNENLASFVGDYGAMRFLKQKYGEESEEYQYYQNAKIDRDLYTNFALARAQGLDSLYHTFTDAHSAAQKELLKTTFIKRFVEEVRNLPYRNENYKHLFESELPNNTYFMSRMRYRAKQNEFKQEFENEFASNFPKYLNYLKEKHPSLF